MLRVTITIRAVFPRITSGSFTVYKQLMVPKARQKDSRKEKQLNIWGPGGKGAKDRRQEGKRRCSVLPVVRVPGRERRLLETVQLAIGEFITDSSQGLPPSPRV